jgi:hypothetical protein
MYIIIISDACNLIMAIYSIINSPHQMCEMKCLLSIQRYIQVNYVLCKLISDRENAPFISTAV